MNRLPYVEATILELHRYKTLGHMAVARRTLKDTEVGGYFITKGTSVSLHIVVFYSIDLTSELCIMPNNSEINMPP